METLFVGQNLIELSIVDSTNNYAANRLNATKLPEGTVIMAYEQEAGRGQRGNNWEAEPYANLTVSIVFYPTFLSVGNQFLLSKTIALGIFDYLKTIVYKPVWIKWPNDIFVGEQKISGVLIENSLQLSALGSSIVGIGLNVNQRNFENLPNATSLYAECGREMQLKNCLSGLCQAIERRYLQLRAGKYDSISADYLSQFLFLKEWRAFKCAEEVIDGRMLDVDNSGQLIIEHRSGELAKYDVKEIEFVL